MAIEFMPVFLAGSGPNGPKHIEFRFPNTQTIPLTAEAPDGFEGAWVFNAPPILPCVVITSTEPGGVRHVPNRILRNAADVTAFRAEFTARKRWKYQTGAGGDSLAEKRAAYDLNESKRNENKARGEAAIESAGARN